MVFLNDLRVVLNVAQQLNCLFLDLYMNIHFTLLFFFLCAEMVFCDASRLNIPPKAVALARLTPNCAGGGPVPASLRFCFEFDVVIDCCGSLSEAENERNQLFDLSIQLFSLKLYLIYCIILNRIKP